MSDLPEYQVDPKWLAEMEQWRDDAHHTFLASLGRLTRALDEDAGLLMRGGVDITRMSLLSYEAEPLRRTLCVDGNPVRDYTLTIAEPRGAEVLDEHELRWTEEMPEHTRLLAEAVIEWARADYEGRGALRPLTVNTPVGPVQVRMRR
jgi:hypothetical protein